MKKYILYKHTFPNGKVYIGITSKNTAELRWKKGRGYSTQERMAKAIKEFGWDNIKHEILLSNIPEEEVTRIEQETISFYKSNNPQYGYNILSGGLDSFQKEGNSVLMYDLNGKYLRSFLTILDACDFLGVQSGGSISAACRGERKSIYGYQWRYYQEDFPEEIEPLDFYSSKRIKKVDQYTLTGEYIQTYDSISVAAKELGKNIGPDIGKVCCGKRKTAGGFIWKYHLE